MSTQGRTVFTAQLSAEAYQGWSTYAAAHGVTMTALAEAIGVILPAGIPRRIETELISIARQVTAERKSRRR